jgi:hypothetical protein
MTANTSKRQGKNEVLATLASLSANAVDLINKGKREPEMVEKLLKALQLFKENRLGDAVPNPDPAILLEQKRRRERFFRVEKRKFDHDPKGVPLAVLRISWRASACAVKASALPDSLRDIVKLTEDQIYRLVGLNTMKEFKQLLAEHGMYFAMTEEHIREAFGS